MDIFNNIAKRAENLLESVDRNAAKAAEDLKQTPQRRVIAQANETVKRLESRQRYTPRTRGSLSADAGVQDVAQQADDNIVTQEEASNVTNPEPIVQTADGLFGESSTNQTSFGERSDSEVDGEEESYGGEGGEETKRSIDLDRNISDDFSEHDSQSSAVLVSSVSATSLAVNEILNSSSSVEERSRSSTMSSDSVTLAHQKEHKGVEATISGQEHDQKGTQGQPVFKPASSRSTTLQQSSGHESLAKSSNGLTGRSSTPDLKSNVARGGRGGGGEDRLEVAKLETELDEMDAQLIHMQSDLDAAQEALLRSQQVCAERESKLQDTMRRRDKEHEQHTSELMDALHVRDSQISDLQQQIDSMVSYSSDGDKQQQASLARIQQLERELKDAQQGLHVHKNDVAAAEDELRGQNDDLQEKLQEQRRQILGMQDRSIELERVNAEVSFALVEVQRQLEESEARSFDEAVRVDLHGEGGNGGGGGGVDAVHVGDNTGGGRMVVEAAKAASGSIGDTGNSIDLEEAEESRRAAEALLSEETNRSRELKIEVGALNQLLSASRARAEEWEARYHVSSTEWESERVGFRKQVSDLEIQSGTEGTIALERRLQSLAEHVARKQALLDELTTEKGALTQRLRSLEQQLAEYQREEEDGDERSDSEDTGGGVSRRKNGNGGLTSPSPSSTLAVVVDKGNDKSRLRKRAGNSNDIFGSLRRRRANKSSGGSFNVRRMARLPVIAKHKKLARLVDVLDNVCLTTGAVLYRKPWARLAFVGYVFLLHIWVFYVLEFHTREIHNDVDWTAQMMMLRQANSGNGGGGVLVGGGARAVSPAASSGSDALGMPQIGP